MDDPSRCPVCGAERDHPAAYCDRCDYCPDPRSDLREPLGANPPARETGNVAGVLLSIALGAFLAFYLLADVRDVDRAILAVMGAK